MFFGEKRNSLPSALLENVLNKLSLLFPIKITHNSLETLLTSLFQRNSLRIIFWLDFNCWILNGLTLSCQKLQRTQETHHRKANERGSALTFDFVEKSQNFQHDRWESWSKFINWRVQFLRHKHKPMEKVLGSWRVCKFSFKRK